MTLKLHPSGSNIEGKLSDEPSRILYSFKILSENTAGLLLTESYPFNTKT
jgi:hypothetical protein